MPPGATHREVGFGSVNYTFLYKLRGWSAPCDHFPADQIHVSCKRRRHLPTPEQGQWLGSVVRGHLAYYAVSGNTDGVAAFRAQIAWHWYRALRRRSQRTRLTWGRMSRLRTKWLPPARVLHPFPDARFDATTRGRSPVRLVAHAGICARGAGSNVGPTGAPAMNSR